MIRRPLQAKHTLRAVPHRELLFSDQFLLDITNFFEVYSVLIDIVSPILIVIIITHTADCRGSIVL